MNRLRVAWLPDGKRLHLCNGPVNLIIQAFGPPADVGRAYDAAIERARTLIGELAEDIPVLQSGGAPRTPAALRATAACEVVPGALAPITALSGAVADDVLAVMTQAGKLERGYVNNQGDVAFHLAEGQSLSPEAMDWPAYARYDARVPIYSTARSRGIVAGGWRFAPFAFGYVDRIYVAAISAAHAGAVLGSIATRMLPDDAVQCVPASHLVPDCMLGGIPVYARQPPLPAAVVAAILARGRAAAELFFASGIVGLTLVELNDANILVAPQQFSVKSILSLEGEG